MKAALERVANAAVRGQRTEIADAQALAAVPHFERILPLPEWEAARFRQSAGGNREAGSRGGDSSTRARCCVRQIERGEKSFIVRGLKESEEDRRKATDLLLEATAEGTERAALASTSEVHAMTNILRYLETKLKGEATFGTPKELKAGASLGWFTVSSSDEASFNGSEFTLRFQIVDPDRWGPLERFTRIRANLGSRFIDLVSLQTGGIDEESQCYTLVADAKVR